LNQVVRRVKQWRDGRSGPNEKAEAGDAPRTAEPEALQLQEITKGVPPNSIIGDRLRAIAKMRAAKVKVNVSALQQMSIAREAPKLGLSIPGFAVGFAMLLGLLGTIIGLTMMVQTIHLTLPTGNVAPGSWAQTLENIRHVLTSMKTAFSATLVGLICSISSAALNFRLSSVQSRFFENLERFTIEDLLPATAPSVEDETLLEQVSLQLERSFSRLSEVSDQNVLAIKDLSAVETAFGSIVQNIQQIASNSTTGNLQGVMGQLTGVIHEMTRVNNSVVNLAASMPTAIEAAKESSRNLLIKVDTLVAGNKEQGTRIERTLGAVDESLPRAVSQIRQSNDEAMARIERMMGKGGRQRHPLEGSPSPQEPRSALQRVASSYSALFGGLAVLLGVVIYILFH